MIVAGWEVAGQLPVDPVIAMPAAERLAEVVKLLEEAEQVKSVRSSSEHRSLDAPHRSTCRSNDESGPPHRRGYAYTAPGTTG